MCRAVTMRRKRNRHYIKWIQSKFREEKIFRRLFATPKKTSYQGPVPERPISANRFVCIVTLFSSHFLYLPSYTLPIVNFVLSFLFFFFQVKAQQYFVSSSYMFLDYKTLLTIWLDPGLNLIIFRGTGHRKFYALRWCYTGRFAKTILSATQRYNVGTILWLFETMSQQCCNAVLR